MKTRDAQPGLEGIKSEPKIVDSRPSSDAVYDLAKIDIIYAQKALNKLGYSAGRPDGIWGPKSARAIRKFERSHKLQSARGHLSELNLYYLEKVTKLARESSEIIQTPPSQPLSAKVDTAVPLKGAPQLVIIEQARALMAKPNPYSELLSQLVAGTGIYIISLQEGWYEVESEDQLKGYIKAN